MEHDFTKVIEKILQNNFGGVGEEIFQKSELLQYLNIKTKSAHKGSKARGSFGNIYAVYVLIEDYLAHDFHVEAGYDEYEGAIFSDLFKRQRELPFGAKLQNHALNHRMNQEFRKYFPTCEYVPIIRDAESSRYWINENLLKIKANRNKHNIAYSVIQIIDSYIETKKGAFDRFIKTIEELKSISDKKPEKVYKFIIGLLAQNIDARIFEIVSYAILKYFYHDQVVYFGFDRDNIEEHNLTLYKTGRTNANDGGIDFVMKPLGRFFQVTETTDVRKYFLDIDKIQRFPISFVVKSEMTIDELKENIKEKAEEQYGVKAIVKKYMEAIEELFNIQKIKECFEKAVELGYQRQILGEIILQSKLEFNYEEE
ncbi:MAG: restriction endonuclease [Cytophagales bacterium]|nr:restriction endonuclease [Cytophagales bacterium]